MNAQSWRMTLMEIGSGKVAGIVIAWGLNLWVLPHVLDTQISLTEATIVSMIYVSAATLRSIMFRRLFNYFQLRGIN